MFSGFRAIAYKEFLHVVRDPATRFVFVIPIIQLTLFGYAINLDVEDIPAAWVDLDDTAESRALIDGFRSARSFELEAEVESESELQQRIVDGDSKVGILIPEGYARAIHRGETATVQVIVDGSHSTEANSALNVSRALGLHVSSHLRDESIERNELTAIPPGYPMASVDIRPRLLFNPQLRSPNFFVPGLVGVIMQLVTVLLTAFAIVRERENGTFEQLMVTPVDAWGLLLGKIVPYAVIAAIETVLVVLLMVFAFGVPIAGFPPLLAALSLLFLLTALCLGVIISTAARNQAEAMQVSFLLLLPSILLSGFVFPLESIPAPIYPITFLIPVRYYIEILRGIILRGASFEALWEPAAALAVYTSALLVISAVRFRKRLD